MSKETYLSASRMSTLDKCSWLYWCKYHLKLPDTTNSGALRGTICHLVLELLLNHRHKKHFNLILKKQSIKASKAVDRLVIKFLKDNDIYDDENYPLVDKMIYVALDNDFFGGKGAKIEAPEKEFKIENKDPKYNIYGFTSDLTCQNSVISLRLQKKIWFGIKVRHESKSCTCSSYLDTLLGFLKISKFYQGS